MSIGSWKCKSWSESDFVMVFVEAISVILRCLRLGRNCCSMILRTNMFLEEAERTMYDRVRLDICLYSSSSSLDLDWRDGVLSTAAFLATRPVSWYELIIKLVILQYLGPACSESLS